MNTLSSGTCLPCEGGVEPKKGEELAKLKSQLDQEAPGWELRDAKHLQKEYTFKDFVEALTFVNKVGQIAEAQNHHPVVNFGWGFVKILLWTHAIDGLSQNDFIIASKIDEIN